jgi:hypothetical protein
MFLVLCFGYSFFDGSNSSVHFNRIALVPCAAAYYLLKWNLGEKRVSLPARLIAFTRTQNSSDLTMKECGEGNYYVKGFLSLF